MFKLLEHLRLRHRAHRYLTRHDPGGIAFLNAAVRPGQTVFDIGAHKGGYLFWLRKAVGPDGQIHAFEPQSNLFGYLRGLKNAFAWQNVHLHQMALSETPGAATLYIPANRTDTASSPGATLVAHPERPGFGQTETVGTDTLDGYCQRLRLRPDFLKIDVEGNELPIFRGGSETLKKCRPRILVEIEARHIGQERARETFAFLAALGYQGHFLRGLERVPLGEFRFEKHQNTADMAGYCNNFTFEA